jgi:hypothetical protein
MTSVMEVNLIYFEEAHHHHDHHQSIRSIAVELVEETFRNRELLGSNLGFHTYYPEFRCDILFLSPFLKISGRRPYELGHEYLFPSASFPFVFSSSTCHFTLKCLSSLLHYLYLRST